MLAGSAQGVWTPLPQVVLRPGKAAAALCELWQSKPEETRPAPASTAQICQGLAAQRGSYQRYELLNRSAVMTCLARMQISQSTRAYCGMFSKLGGRAATGRVCCCPYIWSHDLHTNSMQYSVLSSPLICLQILGP